MRRALLSLLLLGALALGLSACGGGSGGDESRPVFRGQVNFGNGDGSSSGATAVTGATRSTTRLGGNTAAADAAAVAAAVYPSTPPSAVALVDKSDWQGGIAASVLSGRPLFAPILVTDGDSLPAVTSGVIDQLKPRGSPYSRGAQAIRIGATPPAPSGLKSIQVGGNDPYATAAAVDRFASVARGKPSADVVIASGEQPAFAMPAAAWAARSGDAVLFAKRDSLPAPTVTALRAHQRPNIFILGPPSAIGPQVEQQLGSLGRVTRIGAPTPADNAVEFARFKQGAFGWGIRVPGYNFTVASPLRPLDAAAAAPLATNGVFAPLLVGDPTGVLPRPLEGYLLDVQPGYESDPSTGVYNHVWILGDERAVTPAAQGRIDQIAALVPVQVGRP